MDHLSATLLEALQQGVSGDVLRMTPEASAAGSLRLPGSTWLCSRLAAHRPRPGLRFWESGHSWSVTTQTPARSSDFQSWDTELAGWGGGNRMAAR